MKTLIPFIFLTFCIFGHIGTRPLANPDEGRYASMGLDMVHTGDWMVPRLNGLLYFEKPPLGYWSIALGQKIFGENLWGARFFNAAFTLFTALSLYLFGRYFLSRAAGLWAAFMYMTAGLPLGMSQMLTLDNALTFYLTTTVLLFASGFLVENKPASRKLFIWAYVFMSFTVLTKGLIGMVIPGLVGLPWLIYTGYIKTLKRMFVCKGILLFLCITIPWHIYMQQKYPCFVSFYFWHEHFARYLSDVHNRMKPWYFLWSALFLGCLPWLFFLPRMLCVNFRQTDQRTRYILSFFLIWPLIIVLFFSQSHSQLIPYILPAIPGIILFIAYGWTRISLKNITLECGLWGLLFIVAACVLPHIVEKKALIPMPPWVLYSAQGLFLCGGMIALLLNKRSPAKAFYTLCGTLVILYSVFPLYLPYFQRLNAQNVCRVMCERKLSFNDGVYCYRTYCNDVPFYLKRLIGTVNHIPEEHQLGYKLESTERYTTLDLFQKRWQEPIPCYAIVKHQDTSEFEANMKNFSVYCLTEDPFFSLYCNQP